MRAVCPCADSGRAPTAAPFAGTFVGRQVLVGGKLRKRPEHFTRASPMAKESVRTAETAETPSTAPAKGRKKSSRRRVPKVTIHIQSTYNNTLLSATDPDGKVLCWSSAGRIGYAGARKATPYAAQEVVRDLVKRLEPFQTKELDIEVKGIGSSRESAIRALAAHGGFSITSIRDVTPVPHNGCRPPRRRRV